MVNRAAGARSHWPRQGLRIQVASAPSRGWPAGPSVRSRSAHIRSAPARRQAMSSHTWTTLAGLGTVDSSA